ncbi:hypothetical protein ACHAWF_018064 [Thalassiosira exigua]
MSLRLLLRRCPAASTAGGAFGRSPPTLGRDVVGRARSASHSSSAAELGGGGGRGPSRGDPPRRPSPGPSTRPPPPARRPRRDDDLASSRDDARRDFGRDEPDRRFGGRRGSRPHPRRRGRSDEPGERRGSRPPGGEETWKGLDLRDCRSSRELIIVAHDRLEDARPKDLAAFWTILPRLAGERERRGKERGKEGGRRGEEEGEGEGETEGFDRRLRAILARTLRGMRDARPRELAQTALGFARAGQTAGRSSRGGRDREGGLLRVLSDVVVDLKELLFRTVAEASAPHVELGQFDARSLCSLAYAHAIAGVDPRFDDETTLFDLVARAVPPLLDDFQTQTYANLVWSFEKVGRRDEALFDEVARSIIARDDSGDFLREFKPQELSNIAMAYAKSEIEAPDLFDRMGDHVSGLGGPLGGFKSQEASNLLWAYGKAGRRHPALFSAAADYVMLSVSSPRGEDPRCVASVAWAHAMADIDDRVFFRSIANHLATANPLILGRYGLYDLATIAWACATAGGERRKEFYRAVGDEVVARGNRDVFQPQEVANLLYAFGKAEQGHQELFETTKDRVVELCVDLDGFTPHGLCNALWAHAKCGTSHRGLFRAASERIVATKDLGAFGPQGLANVLWSFAKAEERAPELFERVADHVVGLDDLDWFKPQDLSNILWAYATAEECRPDLFRKVAEHMVALEDLGDFAPQAVSNVAWAFAKAGEPSDPLFDKVAKHLVESDALRGFKPQELSNVAWAYAAADVDAPRLFGEGSDFADLCDQRRDGFEDDELSQLYQWHLWRRERGSALDADLSPALADECRRAFFAKVPSHRSALQADVISVLSSLGLSPREEVRTDCGYLLDALVVVKGEDVGVEVDGPFHFVGDRRQTGNTILKRRQVASLDAIPIVSVPYWEWDECANDRERKGQYLSSILGLEKTS